MGVLRLFLSLLVVIGHNQYAYEISNNTIGVFLAVRSFFLISGFYMTLILTDRYRSTPISLFWSNRVLRLLPAYWLILALTFVIAYYSDTNQVGVFINLNLWKSISAGDMTWTKIYLLLSNVSMIGIDTTLYGCIDLQKHALISVGYCVAGQYSLNNFMLVPQAWSISVELLFYGFAPITVGMKNVTLSVVLTIMIIIQILIYLYGLEILARSFAPTEMIYFLLGIVAYRIYATIHWENISRKILFMASAAVWFFFTIGFYLLRVNLWVEKITQNTGILTSWALIILLTLSLPFLFQFTKNNRWDKIIGDLSYPVYICHILVLGIVDQFGGRTLFNNLGGNIWCWQGLNIFLVLLSAQGLVWLVEAPMDKYRRFRLATALDGRNRIPPFEDVYSVSERMVTN